VQRGGDGIRNIPKFHEFFHVIRNIERHGPPAGYSTLTTEGTHIDVKEAAKHTARHVDTFAIQTGQRMYEKNTIKAGFKFVRSFAKSTYIGDCNESKKNHKKISGTRHSKFKKSYESVNELNINETESKQGLFYAKYNIESRKIIYLKDEKNSSTEIRNIDFMSKALIRFFEVSIFMLMEKNASENIVLPCYTAIVRKGFSFRGMSRDESNYPGWALFQWRDKKDNTFGVPGKIITFIDLSQCVFKNEWEGHFAQNDLHVIIQSLTKLPTERRNANVNRHTPLCVSSTLSTDGKGNPEYYCVSVNTILNTAYIIPDFGNKGKHKYLYVYPRFGADRNDDEQIVRKEDMKLDRWSDKF